MNLSFRDSELAVKAVDTIKKLSNGENYSFMHVCGTHEQTITKHGLRSLLPENIRLISGPGCPVCITPAEEIDAAIAMAEDGLTILTYGDMFRVPGTEKSLARMRASGSDIKIVLSIGEAVKLARAEDKKEFVFFSPGLDTTAPTIASEVLRGLPENISILNSLRLTLPVMQLLMGIGDLHFQGFIAPGHVSAIIGTDVYNLIAETHSMPVVISGFEPLDVLISIALLIRQVNEGKPRVENEYSRVVNSKGNVKAMEAVEEVFKVSSGRWRGIGRVPFSKLEFRDEYFNADAMKRHSVELKKSVDIPPGCSCHLVIIGKIEPEKCIMFGNQCTPEKPFGPCMVSSEGTCNIYYRYGSHA